MKVTVDDDGMRESGRTQPSAKKGSPGALAQECHGKNKVSNVLGGL